MPRGDGDGLGLHSPAEPPEREMGVRDRSLGGDVKRISGTAFSTGFVWFGFPEEKIKLSTIQSTLICLKQVGLILCWAQSPGLQAMYSPCDLQ